jgi:hypothetical protein
MLSMADKLPNCLSRAPRTVEIRLLDPITDCPESPLPSGPSDNPRQTLTAAESSVPHDVPQGTRSSISRERQEARAVRSEFALLTASWDSAVYKVKFFLPSSSYHISLYLYHLGSVSLYTTSHSVYNKKPIHNQTCLAPEAPPRPATTPTPVVAHRYVIPLLVP